MTSDNGSDTEDSREERLGSVFAECSDRLNTGESLDFEKVVADHPELAPELAHALEALRDLGPALEPASSSRQARDASPGQEAPHAERCDA